MRFGERHPTGGNYVGGGNENDVRAQLQPILEALADGLNVMMLCIQGQLRSAKAVALLFSSVMGASCQFSMWHAFGLLRNWVSVRALRAISLAPSLSSGGS